MLLQGDLNDRTGNDNEYIIVDKTDSEMGIENLENQRQRNSEDKTKNARGNELLDICKVNDILILNGRTTGDIFGNYTCHNWNGSSVVDYFLAQNHFCDRITHFSVGEYIPWLSDHCIIKTTLSLKGKSTKCLSKKLDETVLHPGFVWNEHSKKTYENNLLSPTFSDRINNLMASIDLKPMELAAQIKSILFDNAKNSDIKQKKLPGVTQKSEP